MPNRDGGGGGGAPGPHFTGGEVASDIFPDVDGTLNIGTAAARFAAAALRGQTIAGGTGIAGGNISAAESSLALGYFGLTDPTVQTISAGGRGSIAAGETRKLGVGVGTAKLTAGPNDATVVLGVAMSADTFNAEILASRQGTMAGGAVLATSGDSQILNSGNGAFCWGDVHGYNSAALLHADGTGSFASGKVQDGTIHADRSGSFAQGNSYNYSGTPNVLRGIFASGSGAFAQGSNYHYGGSGFGAIRALGHGSFAQGRTNSTGTGSSVIEAAGIGSFARGHARQAGADVGLIRALGDGSMAFGVAYGSTIQASAEGGFAGGHAFDNNSIIAAVAGSFAFGRVTDPSFDISAGGFGCLSFGLADTASIISGATNAAQFGPGSNLLGNSLKVGLAGIRFKGTVGAPGTPVNGDMWVDAVGDIFVRTGGISKNMTNIT